MCARVHTPLCTATSPPPASQRPLTRHCPCRARPAPPRPHRRASPTAVLQAPPPGCAWPRAAARCRGRSRRAAASLRQAPACAHVRDGHDEAMHTWHMYQGDALHGACPAWTPVHRSALPHSARPTMRVPRSIGLRLPTCVLPVATMSRPRIATDVRVQVGGGPPAARLCPAPPSSPAAHLPGKDRVELLFRHAGPAQHARPLHLGRRTDDGHGVHQPLGAALVQQRYIHYSQLVTLPGHLPGLCLRVQHAGRQVGAAVLAWPRTHTGRAGKSRGF